MLRVAYKSVFIRLLKRCPEELQELAILKIDLFKDPKNHKQLGVHKLKGWLKDKYGFWVTKKIRITFEYASKEEVFLLAIGDHDIYRRR